MAKITGIEKASYKELVEARDAIDAALAQRKEEERAEVKRKIAELANGSGFEINELFGGNRGKRRGRLPVLNTATRKTRRRPGLAGAGSRIGWSRRWAKVRRLRALRPGNPANCA